MIKTAFKAPVELSKILVKAPSGIGGGRVFDCEAHHGCLEESFNLPHCRHEPVALTGRTSHDKSLSFKGPQNAAEITGVNSQATTKLANFDTVVSNLPKQSSLVHWPTTLEKPVADGTDALRNCSVETPDFLNRGFLYFSDRIVQTGRLKKQIIDAADFCEFCKRHRTEIVGRRLNSDRLSFVQTFVFPPSHMELLPVREARKEPAEYEAQTKKEAGFNTAEAEPDDDWSVS